MVALGEQRVVGSQTSDLDVLRLLDLDDHLRVREHGVGVWRDRSALRSIVQISEPRAFAGPGLEDDLVSSGNELPTPADVSPTRCSSVLISVGTPTTVMVSVSPDYVPFARCQGIVLCFRLCLSDGPAR